MSFRWTRAEQLYKKSVSPISLILLTGRPGGPGSGLPRRRISDELTPCYSVGRSPA